MRVSLRRLATYASISAAYITVSYLAFLSSVSIENSAEVIVNSFISHFKFKFIHLTSHFKFKTKSAKSIVYHISRWWRRRLILAATT